MDLYGIDGLSARALQKFFYEKHGTTLRGLMESDAMIEPAGFLDFVHDIDRSLDRSQSCPCCRDQSASGP